MNLETKVNRALTSPQLGSSSIEDGTLEEYDENGQLVTIIGKQPDGTHGAVVVSGPVPPRPSAPAVAPGPGLLSYGWDGNFADETTGETDITVPAPMDFGRVEAHASKLQGFAADTAATLLDTLESPRGGSRTVMLEPGTWFVKLVTRALSGKRSAESLEVSVEVLPPSSGDVDVDALREEFQAADAQLNEALGQLAVSKIGLDRLEADGQLTTVVADQMFSELFATRKLYANQIVVGQPGNLHPDPGFNDPGFLARMAANSTCQVTLGGTGDLQLTNPGSALQLFRPMGTAPTLEGVLSNGWAAVTPGDSWSFSVTVSSWQGTSGGIRFLGRGADGSTEVPITGFTPINTTTGRFTLEATIPTGCRWILPEVLVAQGISYITRGTIEFRQKITPSMIVDGFFQGQRVIGASIETNAAADVGLKFNDQGITSHGIGTLYDPVAQTNVQYKNRIKLATLAPSWSNFASDRAPGISFESNRDGPSSWTSPAIPAKIMASSAQATGVSMESSQQDGTLDYRSLVTVDQTLASLVSQGPRASAAALPSSQGVMTVNPFGFRIAVMNAGVEQASIVHISGNPLNVTAALGMTLNGNQIAAPGPWINLPLINGWKITNSLKMRPSYRVVGDSIEFRGSVSGGTSNIICQMPTAVRALKEENKGVPQFNSGGAGWIAGTVSVAPDGFVRLDTYSTNVYSVNLDFSYSRSE